MLIFSTLQPIFVNLKSFSNQNQLNNESCEYVQLKQVEEKVVNSKSPHHECLEVLSIGSNYLDPCTQCMGRSI